MIIISLHTAAIKHKNGASYSSIGDSIIMYILDDKHDIRSVFKQIRQKCTVCYSQALKEFDLYTFENFNIYIATSKIVNNRFTKTKQYKIDISKIKKGNSND